MAQGRRDSEQGRNANVQYVGTALAPGASPSTVEAATEVGLFAADIFSPKFAAALAKGLITPATP